ncbi:hypothetical protein HC752_21945 [Vibrio sp. S9_S30]|uniref:hypothetical protein n=1 Tax=Vibrio sp. S9_S30 TaxID=2720226 RepID=UPI0016801545|nr:hypothetical protein [Vibrio sp. S9_S30]MBD1559610.1 hypothetical protein [Vibrio sp. S9_S30]
MTSKYAMNKSEAAKYWGKSPNTIKKVIEQNNVKPCGKDARGNEVYECKDLAPFLVDARKTSRRRNKTLSESQINEIQELLDQFGSMKEFKEYEMAITQQMKRKQDMKQLVQSNDVVTVWGGTFAMLFKKLRQITTEVERISPEWSAKQSERLDSKLQTIGKEITKKGQEYADELQKHL